MQENHSQLNSAQLLELYIDYLKTPREDFQGQLRKPVRSNTLKSMISIHNSYAQAKLVEELIAARQGELLFWSDLHLFHHNIIRYSNRPFDTVQQMNEALVTHYVNQVKEQDIVVFGGDISFGSIEDTIALLRDLPGKKILVLGNHDFDKKLNFADYGVFDATVMAFAMNESVENISMNFAVSHYPIHTPNLPEGVVNIHGHIHQYSAGKDKWNMSVEHTGYAPVSLSMLKKLHELQPMPKPF